jgi:hypothetical protein
VFQAKGGRVSTERQTRVSRVPRASELAELERAR